jgi:hypothetical protein
MDDSICPECQRKTVGNRRRICPACDCQLRYPGDYDKPIGRQWWVWVSPRSGFRWQGWVPMTELGEKMQFNESTTPTFPSEYTPINRSEERDFELTEAARRRALSNR